MTQWLQIDVAGDVRVKSAGCFGVITKGSKDLTSNRNLKYVLFDTTGNTRWVSYFDIPHMRTEGNMVVLPSRKMNAYELYTGLMFARFWAGRDQKPEHTTALRLLDSLPRPNSFQKRRWDMLWAMAVACVVVVNDKLGASKRFNSTESHFFTYSDDIYAVWAVYKNLSDIKQTFSFRTEPHCDNVDTIGYASRLRGGYGSLCDWASSNISRGDRELLSTPMTDIINGCIIDGRLRPDKVYNLGDKIYEMLKGAK